MPSPSPALLNLLCYPPPPRLFPASRRSASHPDEQEQQQREAGDLESEIAALRTREQSQAQALESERARLLQVRPAFVMIVPLCFGS